MPALIDGRAAASAPEGASPAPARGSAPTPPPVTRRRAARAERPAFVADDAAFLAQLPLHAAIALLVPERYWEGACVAIERIASLRPHPRDDAVVRAMRRFGPAGPGDALASRAVRREHTLQVLRERIAGWAPALELAGAEHLEHARSAGTGAVLWVAHFGFNALAGKMAIARAGFEVEHVSRPEHGFSKSRFGIRALNPIRTGAERRYLARRIVFDRADPAASMHEARRALRENRFVSITAGAWEGQRLARVDVGGAGWPLSIGAPRLAAVAGAPLIPVFVVRDPATRRLRVEAEAPIPLARGARPDAIARAAQAFADAHLPYLRRWPRQWREWEKLSSPAPATPEPGC